MGIFDGRELIIENTFEIAKLVAQSAHKASHITGRVEIKTMMWEKPFDLDDVNKLVAEKYDLKKKKAQYVMSSINKLYGILTKEQLEMMD